MKTGRRAFISSFVTLIAALASGSAVADTFGKLEHVRVTGGAGIEVTAKLDTAVEQSSLHAVDMKYFQRDGDTWVRFTVDNGSVLPGSRVTLEKPVIRDVKIKQKGGGVEHHPLVEVQLCLGDRSFKSKLSLADRTGYTAPLLIGASDLAALGAVDAARQFTHEPSCKPAVDDGAQKAGSAKAGSPATAPSNPLGSPAISVAESSAYSCDGRTYCNQMHSCAEAKFFLKNCPDVKMDGDGDGIPCEEQWCH